MRPPLRIIATLSLTCAAFVATSALAAPRPTDEFNEPYSIPNPNPGSIEEIQDVVGKNAQTQDGEIYQDLSERALCGGWDMTKTNADLLAQIPTVKGVPGRKGDPLGDIPSGMAVRDEQSGLLKDGFLYPSKAQSKGWSTACKPGDPATPPYLDDKPPCKDKNNNNMSTPGQCTNLCVRINKWQYPVWKLWWMNSGTGERIFVCEQIGRGGTGWEADECCERDGTDPDVSCAEEYGANMNIPQDAECTYGNPPGEEYLPVAELEWHYCCTKAIATQMNYEACTLDNPGVCVAHPDGERNCMRCEGDGVPDPNNPDVDFNNELVERGPEGRMELGCRGGPGSAAIDGRVQPGKYVSFYREYSASYERSDSLKEFVPEDAHTKDQIPVACYGFYREVDPKERAMKPEDARCVIAGYTENQEFVSLKASQKGTGHFGEERTVDDPSPLDEEELRKKEFNADQDLWFPNLGGGFSLLNPKVLKEKYGENVINALSYVDTAKYRATTQVSSAQPRAEGIRAFDDTGNPRTVVSWWQQQQTQAQRLVHPAVVTLILPASWSAGIDSANALFGTATSATSSMRDVRRESIEIQLDLREDLLGEIVQFLRTALLLPIEQRPVTVVVPVGSATTYRAYKEGWIRWKETQEHFGGSVPEGTDALIAQLEQYAERIDETRAMRADLTNYIAAVLRRQGDGIGTIALWLEQNGVRFQEFWVKRKESEVLLEEWKKVEDLYREFHDGTNMPWCKNDRFTTPIYSLLDPWLPGRPTLTGKADAAAVPEILEEETLQSALSALPRLALNIPRDITIDLTAFEGATKPLLVPVLQPIQVLPDNSILAAPGHLDTAPNIPTLPPLPPVPRLEADPERIPQMKADATIITHYPNIEIPSNAVQTLAAIKSVIEGMQKTYATFWDAVTKPRCGTPEGDKRCATTGQAQGDCCVLPGEEKYCRKGWGTDTCVHPEDDLLERFTRIGDRPAIFFPADFQSIAEQRINAKDAPYPPCKPEDWACLDLHGTEEFPREGWAIDTSAVEGQEEMIDALRRQKIQETLLRDNVEEKDRFIYTTKPSDMTRSFDKLPPIKLIPEPRQSSSSSTSSRSAS